jgi:hypothetical protein
VNTRIDKAINIDYWRELNPSLSIEAARPRSSEPLMFDEKRLAELDESLTTEGYFQTPSVLPGSEVQALTLCIERIKSEGWFPVFGFLYDEFWRLRNHLRSLIAKFLGESYRQLPDFWAWYVEPNATSKGWEPHRDRPLEALREDGTPNTLTIWLPLTDANPLNGCIYVLPASVDRKNDVWFKALIENVQGIRALPADSGSILGWRQNLLHWGGRSCDRAQQPRISIGFEFQRGDIEPCNRPLLDPVSMPDFTQRLGLIGKQILQYQSYNGLSQLPLEVGQLASELHERYKQKERHNSPNGSISQSPCFEVSTR